jgi:enamine deaminase RidA (YjgF/YER057c/UK114 family)
MKITMEYLEKVIKEELDKEQKESLEQEAKGGMSDVGALLAAAGLTLGALVGYRIFAAPDADTAFINKIVSQYSEYDADAVKAAIEKAETAVGGSDKFKSLTKAQRAWEIDRALEAAKVKDAPYPEPLRP